MFANHLVVVGLFCDYSLGTVPMEAGCRLTFVFRVSALELVVRLVVAVVEVFDAPIEGQNTWFWLHSAEFVLD